MKIAKAFWSLGSLLVNGVIVIYVILSSKAPSDLAAKFKYINDNWDLYNPMWRVEFLLMMMIAIGAFHFAINSKKISWSIILFGQIVLLLTYPIMLGGYRNTPLEVAEMANQVAILVFVFGNVVFLGGLFHLYLTDILLKRWLRYTAAVLSGIATLVFIITFTELISWKQAMIVGPLMNVVYIINAYYGLKIELNNP